MKTFNILWLSAFLMLAYVTVVAQEKGVDASQPATAGISLSGYLSFLEDKTAQLSMAEVMQPEFQSRFRHAPKAEEALSFGYTQSAYWLRLVLRNSSDKSVQRLLEIRYAMLSDIELFQPQQGASQKSGMHVPFAARPYPNRNFVFPLTLEPLSEQVLYLRVSSANSVLLPLWLWSPQEFQRFERHDHLLQAAYFGFACAMILFNLFLFIALRDRIYLFYVMFASSLTFALSVQNGLAAEWLWFVSAQGTDMLLTTGYSLALASLVLFMRRMLNLAQLMPRINRWLNIPVAVFLLVPLPLGLFIHAVIEPVYMLATALLMLILAIAVACAWQRQRSAYFFVVAFTLFLCGSIVNALMMLGTLPNNIFTVNALQFGSILEMLLLSFALADRLNQMRQDNLSKHNQLMQAQAQTLQAQQQLLESLQASELLLEQRVAQRTAELSNAHLALESSNAELRAVLLFNETILLNSPLPMAVFAADGRRVQVNEAYAQLVGATRKELLGSNFKDSRVGTKPELTAAVKKVFKEQCAQTVDVHFVNLVGIDIWLECRLSPIQLDGSTHLLVQLVDLTERKQHEEELKSLAFNDALTRLPNRRLFLDRLKQALLANKRVPSYGAVLFLDLNLFKQLNDAHGHDAGDHLLVEVARRLTRIIRDTDTVARFGGDEFVVLLEGLGTDADKALEYAEQAAGKIQQTLSEEYVLDAIKHRCTVSIGIRLFFNEEFDPDAIIKGADEAMYRAKKAATR